MNSFGKIFRLSIFGESHGAAVGVTIDGCPPGIRVNTDDFAVDLSRRKPGRIGTTPRIEDDKPLILSGIFNDITTGAPITITFENKNTNSKDYSQFVSKPRPGHADLTASRKFHGYNDYRGGGHFSGRLTLPLVAAGVIAKKIISPAIINAEIIEAGGRKDIDNAVKEALENGDTIGGIVECRVSGIPIGWGEPFFNSVESAISHIVFAIPAVKGIEFGSGFELTKMFGSRSNDLVISTEGKTDTNHSGGINGGITNGNEIVFRVAVKPASSIKKAQKTINLETGEMEDLKIEGRHDSCIALRVPPVLEAAAAISLADMKLIAKSWDK